MAGPTLICQHVWDGAMPEVVIIDHAVMIVAVCHTCARATENDFDAAPGTVIVPVSPADNIPNKELWNIDAHFPADGCYQLFNDRYQRQPDLPPPGEA